MKNINKTDLNIEIAILKDYYLFVIFESSSWKDRTESRYLVKTGRSEQ